ncbi:hypothetical protein, partial [Aminobacter sp. J15]|uniref:hypothetical protein n=1 Tax=Aminobacter sp. J15 TaxID=935260 RepID=UPI001AED1B47
TLGNQQEYTKRESAEFRGFSRVSAGFSKKAGSKTRLQFVDKPSTHLSGARDSRNVSDSK